MRQDRLSEVLPPPDRHDPPDTTTRQDLRDDKIGTDHGGSDVPPTPTKFFLSDATRSTSVVRDRSRRAVLPSNPETDPEPPNQDRRTLMCDPYPNPYFL